VLNPICRLLALLGAHHILHVSRIRVNYLYLSVNMPPYTPISSNWALPFTFLCRNFACIYNILWRNDIVTGRTGWTHAKTPNYGTTLFRLSIGDFSVYLRELLSLSAVWGNNSSANISQFNMRGYLLFLCAGFWEWVGPCFHASLMLMTTCLARRVNWSGPLQFAYVSVSSNSPRSVFVVKERRHVDDKCCHFRPKKAVSRKVVCSGSNSVRQPNGLASLN